MEGVENFVRCVDNLFTIVVNVEFNNGIYPAFIESLLFNSGNLIIDISRIFRKRCLHATRLISIKIGIRKILD